MFKRKVYDALTEWKEKYSGKYVRKSKSLKSNRKKCRILHFWGIKMNT